eukprot:scaffold171686_cov30-Tisochrysis_lutea.AAC.3
MMRIVNGLIVLLLLFCLHVAVHTSDEADRARWPLIYAAGEGDAETVRKLLAAGHPVDERSKDGESALHVAGIRGDIATVRLLLDGGADVNARTPPGITLSMTPLHWAIYHGHTPMVEMLLTAGADPSAIDEHGKTPLKMCDEAGQIDAAALVREAIRRRQSKSGADGEDGKRKEEL